MSSAGGLPDWASLGRDHDPELVDLLQTRWEKGSFGISAAELAEAGSKLKGRSVTEGEAELLLENAGSWLQRQTVPGEIDPDFPDEPPLEEVRYVYESAPNRRIPWIVMVHGMNTAGRWQEFLAFDLGVWQGKAPPMFVHKYGRVVVGAVIGFRRRRLVSNLRERVVELAGKAEPDGAGPRPDVVAHSLGTWLVGHLLLGEAARPKGSRIQLGRVILTGSILRPDFPWAHLQQEGVVGDVLNHYATGDKVVPLAHFGVGDSGPSGTRGFDIEPGAAVLNVVAPDFGHSDVLNHSNGAYARYMAVWRPFLTNPLAEPGRGIEVSDPPKEWKQKIWPLRRGRRKHKVL